MDITETKTVRARKPHTCYWCGEHIEVGTNYKRWTCFDEGDVLVTRTHPECCIAWQELDFPDNEEVPFGGYNRGCTCEKGRCECVPPAVILV